MEKKNVRIVQRVISDLEIKLMNHKNVPEVTDRDKRIIIIRLNDVIADLKNYNDLKEILKKIID